MKEFPPFRLDIADRSLWRDGQRVHLTPKAFAILRYLVERAGRLVTQNELLEAHWPDTFVQPEVLKSQILDIRTALGDRPKEPRFIETVSRQGYRFIAAVRDAVPPEPEVSGKLVGRDKALEELRGCLRKASGGERQIAFITGEQGMGKTTLVEAFLEEVSGTGIHAARGQCLEGFGVVKEPYYPVLEALGQLARAAKREALAQVLETHAPTWLIQLPALMKPEHRGTLQRELLGATRERMIREICEALETLTEADTLVLLFEDLHWSDHSTIDLIAAIAHRRSPARLLLIGTYRPVDLVLAQHPLKQVSHSLKAKRLSREIALSPLGETDIAEYLSRQAAVGDSGLARWIRKQTEGNPLFMVTVIDHLLDLGHIALKESVWIVATTLEQIEVSVPDTLRQTIELQIDRLSPREQLTLDAASVHGIVFSAGVTAAALEVDTESVEDTCQKLAQHSHIIRTAAGERFEFVHAAFRSVFYHRLTPARRAKLHRRFAEKIESLCIANPDECATELAGHFEQCADWQRAIEYLLLSARNAWRRFAYREAISILEHALGTVAKLKESERTEIEIRVLHSLAILQYALHDIARAIPAMETLAMRSAAYGIVDKEVFALLALAGMRATEDSRACVTLLERMQSLISKQPNPLAQAQNRAQYASMQISVFGWNEDMAKENTSALAQVMAGGDRLESASLLMDHCYLDWASSRYSESLSRAQECMPVLLEAGRLVRFLHGRDLVAINLAFLGQLGRALDVLDESIEGANRNEASLRLAMTLIFKACVHAEIMDYNSVSEMCATALPLLGGPFLLDRTYIGKRLAASAELGLGHYDSALERLLEVRAAEASRPVTFSWYWRMPLQLEIAEAWLAKGDLMQARLEADRSIDLTLATAERMWQARALEISARVALEQGDDERVESDLKNALSAMDGFDVPLAAWRVHGTAAKVYGRRGNAELERVHLELSQGTIGSLAKSLDTRPDLQHIFLSAAGGSRLPEKESTRFEGELPILPGQRHARSGANS